MFKMPSPTLILPLPVGGGGNRRRRGVFVLNIWSFGNSNLPARPNFAKQNLGG